MFKNYISLLATAAVVCAAPINWDDPSLYKNVNFNDKSLYKSVDFSNPEIYKNVNFADLPFFVLQGGSAIVNERVDPIMAPGSPISQHVHSFAGANVVSPSTTYEDLQQATCSTFEVKADKSSYWNPILYAKLNDGKFIRVPEQGRRKIYYLYGGAGNSNDETISPFPKGFKMIAGDPGCTNAECAAPYKLKWTCFSNNQAVDTTGFPTGQISCPGGWLGGGLRSDIFFPNCWNGQPFDIKNPHAHMAFDTGFPGLAGCPATHQAARFPQLHAEVYYNVDGLQAAGAADSPLTLSFGDTTGYGFHIDFMSGWDEGVLGNAIKTCRVGDSSNAESLAKCFGADGIWDAAVRNSCKLPSQVREDVGWNGEIDDTGGKTIGGIVNALPGCQTLTKAGDAISLKTCDTAGQAISARDEVELDVRGAVRIGDDGIAVVAED